jgi:hypothetical protein
VSGAEAFVPGAAGAQDDDAKEKFFVFFKGFAKASSMSDGLLESDLAFGKVKVTFGGAVFFFAATFARFPVALL